MHQRTFLLSLPAILCGALILIAAGANAQHTSRAQSFYIGVHFFSDSLPDGYEEILEAVPAGEDVRVRIIRISLANRYCGGQLVRAVECVLPNTTMSKVTGAVDPCSFTQAAIDSALKSAKPKGVTPIEDSATLSIVAKCGPKERLLELPYPEEVDFKALETHNPRVRALWNLYYNVRVRSFGEHFSFHDPSAEQERESEDLGTKCLPELVSGKFESGFIGYSCASTSCDGNYLAWRLRGYTGAPVTKDIGSVELLNATALHLVKSDLPKYPPLAKQTRVSGEVRLKIFPDAQTGLVRDVQLVSGTGVLADPAVDAAKKWQFSQGSTSDQPVEAVLKFDLRCPGE